MFRAAAPLHAVGSQNCFFICTTYFSECPYLVRIQLDNHVNAVQGYKAGNYARSSYVNGKPSFKMGEQAIWYNTEYNEWLIGSIDYLGQKIGQIYTKNEFGGLTNEQNVWKYFDNGIRQH